MVPIPDPKCLEYAPLIAVAVALLKRIPFLSHTPKVVTAVLATLAFAFPAFATGGAVHTAQIVSCILTSFAGAIATHEVVLKPVGNAIRKGNNA